MSKFNLSVIVSFFAGLLFSFIGFVNLFWGNDPFYGLMVFSLSLLFYFPIIQWILNQLSPKMVLILKVIIGLFILWSSLGVGELFSKIKIMREQFPHPKVEAGIN
jgi:cobalamin biosynthesis protein CobD/CbiB